MVKKHPTDPLQPVVKITTVNSSVEHYEESCQKFMLPIISALFQRLQLVKRK